MNLRLKDLILKTTSSLIIGYMLMGNVCISGIGLAKVIAEEIQNFDISIKDDTVRYVQYNQENYKGVILQEKIVVSENSDANNYAPIQRMEYQIEVPRINNVLPERINILKANTELTKPNADNFNQNYDMNTGILNISYENNKDKDGNCYSEYKANANDNFEIIYIYPQEAYLENSPEIDINTKIKTKVNYYSENEIKTIEKSEESKRKQKENIGEIVSLDTTSISDIYKGYMYSNEENKTKYSTNYEIKSNLNILNSQITDEIKINLSKSDYIINQNKIVSTDTIIYHVNKINENDFNKILGENGYIEAYIENQKYATIRYLDADEQGNRKFATVYENEEKTNDEEAGRIVYQDNVKDVILKTSKPITEGSIEIQTQKSLKPIDNIKIKEINSVIEKNKIEVIKRDIIDQEKKDESGNLVYDENGNIQKQQIEKITQIETKENAGKIILKEPTTQMSMEINNNNISTLTNNKIALTIKMDDTNSSCNLFKAGKMEITLPQNLVNSKITNAQSLYTNGLQVTNAKIENGKVILDIQGKQTNYDIQNISGGVNIIVELELDIDDSTPTHEETLQTTFNNTSVSQKVNIVSKEGVLLLNKIYGLQDDNTIYTLDNSEKSVLISKTIEKKEITQKIYLINNYNRQISDIEVLCNLDNENKENAIYNKLNNNIEIKGNKVNYKIYYKNNKGEYSENYSNDAIGYKIKLENTILEPNSKIEINLKMNLPEKLEYNQEGNITNKVLYKIDNQIKSEDSNIRFYTEKRILNNTNTVSNINNNMKIIAQEVKSDKISIEDNVSISGKTVEEDTSVNAGQIIRHKVKLKNISTETLDDIKLNIKIENAVYYELQTDGCVLPSGQAHRYKECSKTDTERESTKYSLKPNEEIEYEYQIRASDEANNMSTRIRVLQGDEILKVKVINNIINQAELKVEVINEYNEEVKIYSEGKFYFLINIDNIYNDDINNVNVFWSVPNELNYDISDAIEEDKQYDEVSINGNVVVWHINKIEKGKKIQIPVRASSKAIDINKLKIDVSNNVTVETDKATYLSNDYIQTIEQSNANIGCTWSRNLNNEYILKDGETVDYTIKLRNNGIISVDLLYVEISLGTGLEIISANKNNQEIQESYINENKLEVVSGLKIGEEVTIKITAKYNKNLAIYNQDIIQNEIFLSTEKSENRKFVFTQRVEKREEENNNEPDNPSNPDEPDIPTEPDNPDTPDNPDDPEKPDTPDNPNNPSEETRYTISGAAWLDNNKNGQRDEGEILLKDIKVDLYDSAKGQIVKDSEGNAKTATTDENGTYRFEGLEKGSYIVIFEFDTSKYTVTTYQKEGTTNSINSDVILSNVTINGTSKKAGITDKIEISNENIENIDIGLIENATFDLSLDKQISSIQVINKQGTKTTEYNNKNFAKIDLVAKYMNNTNVIINYKFVIKNNGDVTGYVDKLVDNLPSGLEFSSELNKDWYKGSDGNLYTTSLNEIAIKPGETSEVELILTKKTTENTTGTFSNNAELTQISNIEAIEEKAEAKENNKSSADLVISIKTGSVIMYIGITIGCIAIIAAGAYIIKKKVINKEI